MPAQLPTHIIDALSNVKSDPAMLPRAMPPAFYTAPEVLTWEQEAVFLSGWLCLGRADEIPKQGDYFTTDILGEPLIIVRASDNNIRVLSNVCRHRGSIITNGTGSSRRFACPYHHWSYDLNGALLGAPLLDKTEGFDASACNLPSFPVAVWMGWVFVNLDSSAEPLQQTIEPLQPYVQNFHTEEMRTVKAGPEVWPLNWKCLAENFMEGYHLTPVHLKTLHPMTPTRLCEKIPGGAGYTGYKSHYNDSFAGRNPYHPDMTEEERSMSMMVWIYPSFVAAISPNSAVYMALTPKTADSVQTRWGVIAREPMFEDDRAQKAYDFAASFNAEDKARLCEVQRGLNSRFASAGPLAPPDYEGTVWDFYAYMAGKLNQDLRKPASTGT